jgi:release factor glutamine methyltransferase
VTPSTAESSPVQLRDLVREGHTLGLQRLDAQMLLLHAMGRNPHDRAWLVGHDTDTPNPTATTLIRQLYQRRAVGEPVAYLLGQREFHGLTLRVDARVLDPRPDTETLVDWALDCLQNRAAPLTLDLGTGSGAIALALQHKRPDAHIWALDASPDALAVAQHNAATLKLPVRFLQGHWLSNWADPAPQRFDLIASNPPYISETDPHLAALTHEPRQALVSGPDGLADIRLIVAQAPRHLQSGGWLLLEHGFEQAQAVAALLQQQGFAQISHRADLAGHLRCTGGRWTPPPA